MPFTKQPPKYCTAPGCKRPYLARGLCRAHYQRQRAGYAITGDIRRRRTPEEIAHEELAELA